MKRKYFNNLIQILQFSVIGCLNALIDITALNALLTLWPTNHSFWLTVYNSIAFFLAVTNSYFWNSRFTFKANASFRIGEKFGFCFQALTALIVSNAVFLLAVKGIHWLSEGISPSLWQYNIAKLLSMFLSSVYSFFIMKYLIFVSKKQ